MTETLVHDFPARWKSVPELPIAPMVIYDLLVFSAFQNPRIRHVPLERHVCSRRSLSTNQRD